MCVPIQFNSDYLKELICNTTKFPAKWVKKIKNTNCFQNTIELGSPQPQLKLWLFKNLRLGLMGHLMGQCLV